MVLNAFEFIRLLISKFLTYFKKKRRINVELLEIKKEKKRSRVEALKIEYRTETLK